LQAAILSVKLKHLAAWNEARRAHAQFYDELLSGLNGVVLPHEACYARHVYHIYAIRVRMRYGLMMALAEKGIDCGVHYPIPIHRQKAYHFLNLARGRFPVAERCAEELLSLPMYPELTKNQIEYVVDEIRRCVGNG
jgi:dTDP-4-amino-4,6-dideoxygalactose transaminase